MNGMEAATTYLIAAFALFVANINTITAMLGFVLVLIRLTYEVPRAWQVLRALFKHKEKRDE